MRVAHVIPVLRLPRHIDVLDYLIPDELSDSVQEGMLVVVPFRSSIVAGLVVDIVQSDTAKLKSIIRALPITYTCTQEQRAFFHWFASTYYISQATALKTFLPSFPRSFLAGKPTRNRAEQSIAIHEYTNLNIENSPTIPFPTGHLQSPIILTPDTLHNKWSLYISFIKESLAKNHRALIIFPTIHDCELFLPLAQRHAATHQTLLFHSGLSEGILFRQWLELFSSKPFCIIGTRTALCAPLQSLDTLIVDQAERDDHIQHDMNPRFDTRRVAVHMGARASARVLLCSTAPRIEDMSAPYQNIPSKERQPEITCVNLHDEFRRGSSDIFITEPLVQAMKSCLVQGRGVFLFCNRTGLGRIAFCNECGYLFSCPTCDKPLKPFSTPPTLVCEACAYSQSLSTHCPTCASVHIKIPGLGIEKIARTLANYFPKTPIHEISSSKSQSPFVTALHNSKGRENYSVSSSITIGTSYALSACPEIFSCVGLIAALYTDPILSVQDFRFMEHQWQTLDSLRFFARTFDARMLVQAFDTSNHFIKSFINDDYASFANSEKKQREKTGWPPYTKSIHLLYRPSPRASLTEQRLAINDVIGYFSSPAKDSRCSLFLHRPVNKKNQSSVYEVVIRITRKGDDSEIPPSLHEYLRQLPNDWIVDCEPLFF
ncbi:MAG: hypothetical protein Q8P56_00060 [Candidatus Uhrbacteria bacterium]|nr:hypothetical protein [Candidatus Uhrbacteria bacterium]